MATYLTLQERICNGYVVPYGQLEADVADVILLDTEWEEQDPTWYFGRKLLEDGTWEAPAEPILEPPKATLEEQVGILAAMVMGLELDVSAEALQAVTAAAPIKLLSDGEPWRDGLRIPAGVAVVYQGQLYICQKTHIAKAYWPPDGTYDLWRKAGSIGIGEAWSDTANYIEGDTVLFDGVLYTALRYSKGRMPSESPEHWGLKATEETCPQWIELPEGEPVLEGVRCWQDGILWECIMQHIKSTVYKPKAGSSRWQEVTA